MTQTACGLSCLPTVQRLVRTPRDQRSGAAWQLDSCPRAGRGPHVHGPRVVGLAIPLLHCGPPDTHCIPTRRPPLCCFLPAAGTRRRAHARWC